MQNFAISQAGADQFISQLDNWRSEWSEATIEGEIPKANDIVDVGVRMLKSNDVSAEQKVALAEKLMVTLDDYKKTGQKGRKQGVQKVVQAVAGIVHDSNTSGVLKTRLSTVVKAKLYKPQAGQRDKSWFNVAKKWRARKTRKALKVIQSHTFRGDIVDSRQQAEELLRDRPAGSMVFFRREAPGAERSEYTTLVKLPGGKTFEGGIREHRLETPGEIGSVVHDNPKGFLKEFVHIPMFQTSNDPWSLFDDANSSGTYPQLVPGQWGIEEQNGTDYVVIKHEDGGATRAPIEPKQKGKDWTLEELDQAHKNATNQRQLIEMQHNRLKQTLKDNLVEVVDNQEQAEELFKEAKAGTVVAVPSHTLRPKAAEGDRSPQGGLAFENYTVLIRLPKTAENTRDVQVMPVAAGNPQNISLQFGHMRGGRLPTSQVEQMRQARELTGLGSAIIESFDTAMQKISPDDTPQKGDYFFVPKEDGILTMYHHTGSDAEVSKFEQVDLDYRTRPIMNQVQAVLDGEDPESVDAFDEPMSRLTVTASGNKVSITNSIQESGW